MALRLGMRLKLKLMPGDSTQADRNIVNPRCDVVMADFSTRAHVDYSVPTKRTHLFLNLEL